ncbi:hypothetical protein KQX54_004626 [Cotesia glomerata]|uniref:Uncharacterized protein n=1 Tax=Cotesia glomerata TaxID=32391 RepID=A0AAV7HT09_COTGL|nr:hypothetical protein KQX54_004626 [Cotesia glomerata]
MSNLQISSPRRWNSPGCERAVVTNSIFNSKEGRLKVDDNYQRDSHLTSAGSCEVPHYSGTPISASLSLTRDLASVKVLRSFQQPDDCHELAAADDINFPRIRGSLYRARRRVHTKRSFC